MSFIPDQTLSACHQLYKSGRHSIVFWLVHHKSDHMHVIGQLQVMYQRPEDHCNILRVAMPVTTGLILEQSVRQCL